MELIVERWFNGPVTLAGLRGRVVLVYAFQMRCLGCVEHSIPQAKRAHASFPADRVQVIGLHTVFENHDAQSADALTAFVAEHDLHFPIGIDSPAPGESMPRTMRLYDMQGTPTLIAIDKRGLRRRQHLGHLDDAQLEGLVDALVAED
ncbi:MAG TPA: redoxin domain-containing protein [Polyangiales bacterium]|nr:redoxin domain-containing protein [Polyangiales bacterium]